jgi:hypothetical protein
MTSSLAFTTAGERVLAAPARGATQTRVEPLKPLFDGFEGETIASFWRPGNAGDGRYEPGAVAVSKEFARTMPGSGTSPPPVARRSAIRKKPEQSTPVQEPS